MIKMVGYDMAQARREEGLRAGRRRPRGRRRRRAARLLHRERAAHLRGARACARRASAEKFIWDGDNTYGGKVVTNPSGGLLSKGHPLGATGLAQCTELVWQLRGRPAQRQVEGARGRAAAQPRARRRVRRDPLRSRLILGLPHPGEETPSRPIASARSATSGRVTIRRWSGPGPVEAGALHEQHVLARAAGRGRTAGRR